MVLEAGDNFASNGARVAPFCFKVARLVPYAEWCGN